MFVDRANTENAIKAMEPLVDAIRNDGRSIVIAPEGTRALSPRLGAFKKGAFHLAMQAGVPVVPVVIHNAGDVAPKNEFVMRAARVRVDVLPPIDTSDWQVRNLSEHIAEVRAMFLKVLGQEDEQAPPKSVSKKSRAKPAGRGAKA